MHLTAKAFFTVTAGIVPGIPMPEYTRRWAYTSEDYEVDSKAVAVRELSEATAAPKRFTEVRDEAIVYCMSLIDPSRIIYANLEFIWA